MPLLLAEPASDRMSALYRDDTEVVVWWATPVECASAIARAERDGSATPSAAAESFRRLEALARSWIEVQPGDELREHARRLLRVHALRSADALQLAAATIASEHRPPTLELLSLDERLRAAAEREGFRVVEV